MIERLTASAETGSRPCSGDRYPPCSCGTRKTAP
jgi:hypothetical protein